jgi:hypothetical protein
MRRHTWVVVSVMLLAACGEELPEPVRAAGWRAA